MGATTLHDLTAPGTKTRLDSLPPAETVPKVDDIVVRKATMDAFLLSCLVDARPKRSAGVFAGRVNVTMPQGR